MYADSCKFGADLTSLCSAQLGEIIRRSGQSVLLRIPTLPRHPVRDV